jgi:hypothetical protein
MFGNRFLAGMRSRVVQPRIERRGCALQRFERHGTGNIGQARDAFRAQNRQPADGVHRLCAVEKGEPFFRFQSDRFQLRATQCLCARSSFAREKRFAFADQT